MRVHFYATLRAAVGQKVVELSLAEGTGDRAPLALAG